MPVPILPLHDQGTIDNCKKSVFKFNTQRKWNQDSGSYMVHGLFYSHSDQPFGHFLYENCNCSVFAQATLSFNFEEAWSPVQFKFFTQFVGLPTQMSFMVGIKLASLIEALS